MSDPVNNGIVLYPLKSGVTVQVTPLTIIGQQYLQDLAKDEFPAPDSEPFQVEIEDALTPGMLTAPTDSPEYVRLFGEALIRRNFRFKTLVLEKCIQVYGAEAWQVLYAYADSIANLGESPYVYVVSQDKVSVKCILTEDMSKLLYFFLADLTEINQILDIAQRRLPITEGEIIEGFRYFRPVEIQGANSIRTPAIPVAPDLTKIDGV